MTKSFLNHTRNVAGTLCIAASAALLTGCWGGNSKGDADSADVAHDDHADNDIAMTLRSIMDAVKVGEPLDSAAYNFTGTLTDGSGRPLYTDIQGAPGEWEIKVVNPNGVTIRNLYLGDLLPDELTQYILETLQIPDSTLVTHGTAGNDPGANVAIYNFGGGEIIFETKTATAENGEEGPLLNIAIRGEKQTIEKPQNVVMLPIEDPLPLGPI